MDVEDTATRITAALRAAGVTVHSCSPIPGSDMGDIRVMLEGGLRQDVVARAIVGRLSGVIGVRSSPVAPAILYVELSAR